MLPEIVSKYIGKTSPAETDPSAGEVISWGKKIDKDIPDHLFEVIKNHCQVVCLFPDWYIIEKRMDFADLLRGHGKPKEVGVGPSGGFKWVKMTDDTVWSSSVFKIGAMRFLELNPRMRVSCDRDGNERGKVNRIPRVVSGKSRSK